MSDSLANQLLSHLQGAPLQQISNQIGANTEQTSNAISAALPLLLGALGKNSAQPQGAEALFGALQRDHSGGSGGFDLGGLLGSVLGSGSPSPQTNGAGILGHILGNKQSQAASGVSQVSGLSSNNAGQLLSILAPIVMSFLGKQVTQGNLNPSGLSQTLGQEHQQIKQQGGLGGGLLGAVLDQDGDGQVDLGDLMKLGTSLFGNRR